MKQTIYHVSSYLNQVKGIIQTLKSVSSDQVNRRKRRRISFVQVRLTEQSAVNLGLHGPLLMPGV
jgi:hypothetical protein